MVNIKEKLISDVIGELKDLSSDDLHKVKNAMIYCLHGYEITKAVTDVAIYDGDATDYCLKKFLVAKRVQGCTDRTLKCYRENLNRILRAIGKSPQQITSDDIYYYLAMREMKDGLKKITLDNELRFLKTFFNFLLGEEMVQKNPAVKIGKIRSPKTQKKSLTEMEIEKIREACINNRERAIIEILLSTGCRVAELSMIKIEEITDDRILIHGKGQKDRFVYLNAKALTVLKKYLSERVDKSIWLFPGCKSITEFRRKDRMDLWYLDNELVNVEKSIDIGSIESTVRKIGNRAGVDNVHPHRLRRTCATLALQRGMPIEQVSKMLGHEQLSTTQIYLDLQEEELARAHRKYVT